MEAETKKKTVHELLNQIQKKLSVPKDRAFGTNNVPYRNCEDILKAVKLLLEDAVLPISDEMVVIGGRFYVKATVSLILNGDCIKAEAYAREPESSKIMEISQLTGATSSYARKYALNGLFCLDDGIDSDILPPGDDKPEKEQKFKRPNEKEAEILEEVYKKLLDSVPDGKVLDKEKITPVLYAQAGHYPQEIELAGTTAAYLISKGRMEFMCKDADAIQG